MSNTSNPEKCAYTRIAILFIAIGTLIALDSFFNIAVIIKLWPLLTITLGAGLIGIYIKRETAGLIFPASGEYLLFFSGLALYCNFTSWSNMAHLWPLFVIFLGVVFITLYVMNRKRRVLLFLGLILLSLSAFFYFVFAVDIRYWWTIFILVGVSILISVQTK